MTAHSAVLQRPAIDNHLARLTRHTLDCSRKRHLITGPSVWYILDSKGDSDEDIWTLQSHSIDRIMHGVAEEVGLAGGMRRLSTPRRQCIRQCQRSAKSAAVTVTTSTGHVSTVVGRTSGASNQTRQRFPRSNPPPEYRQAGEDAPLFTSRVPAFGSLDPDVRLSRLHRSPGSLGEPGRTALLRPVPAARAVALGTARVGNDQAMICSLLRTRCAMSACPTTRRPRSRRRGGPVWSNWHAVGISPSLPIQERAESCASTTEQSKILTR